MESEETQDNERSKECGAGRSGREDLRTERGERSAEALFRCDNQCSEKTLSYWQLASVVLNEGDEAYTTNLCQKCFNKHSEGKRRKAADKRAVETGGGKEGVSWKNVENDGGRTIFAWNVGILSPRKKQSKEVSRAGR